MGGVHATTQARALGMKRVLVPRAAAGLSALGLLTAHHVIDSSRGYLSPTAEVDRAHLARLAAELEASALEELRVAGVRPDRITLEWSLLLIYPGQTFDTSIPVVSATDVEGAVEEFHRRNAEARLIEARAQEPVLRGVRLTAVGEVEQPADPVLGTWDRQEPTPTGRRRMWVGEAWHDDVPVYDLAGLLPGVALSGPAALASAYTTVIVAPGETARLTPRGDVLVDLGPLPDR
jgi:N-methylhydantoinase A